MAKKILFLLLATLTSSVFAQDKKPQYDKFKTGTYYTIKKRSTDTIFYVRDENSQTEYITKDGKVFKSFKLKLIWVNKSTYILRNEKHTNNSSKFIERDVKCKIIQTGNDYYIVKAKIKGGKWMLIKFHVYKGEFKPNEN